MADELKISLVTTRAALEVASKELERTKAEAAQREKDLTKELRRLQIAMEMLRVYLPAEVHVADLRSTLSALESEYKETLTRVEELDRTAVLQAKEIHRLRNEAVEWKTKFEMKGRRKKTTKLSDMDDETLKMHHEELTGTIDAKRTVRGTKRTRELFSPEVEELKMQLATVERELKSRRLLSRETSPKKVGTFDSEAHHLDHLDQLDALCD